MDRAGAYVLCLVATQIITPENRYLRIPASSKVGKFRMMPNKRGATRFQGEKSRTCFKEVLMSGANRDVINERG